MFEHFFTRSADPIWIFDPAAGVFVDCNAAALELMHAASKADMVSKRPDELAPARQPDGADTAQRVREVVAEVRRQGSLNFEWLARRVDGTEPAPLQDTGFHRRAGPGASPDPRRTPASQGRMLSCPPRAPLPG